MRDIWIYAGFVDIKAEDNDSAYGVAERELAI